MDIKQAAKVLKALSHPNRLEIYLSIVKGDQGGFQAAECECCVSEIMASLKIGAPTVSHHLKELANLQKHKFKCLTKLIGQHGAKGALPTIRAAVDSVKTGNYYGPNCLQLWGPPVEVPLPEKALNAVLNSSLWDESVRLTKVKYHC